MEENTYIIETINLNNSNDDDDPLKGCELNETATPVIISTTDLNKATKYVTCYENGEIVLNKIDTSVVNVNASKHNEIKTLTRKDKSTNLNTYTRVLPKVQQKQKLNTRKKLCYETPHNIQQLKPDAPIVLKHPRKQLIDQRTMISPREFKRQLIYTADTITTTKLAPCTRQQLLHVLNGITTLFAHPAHKMPNSNLMQLYVSRCTCKKEANMMSTDDMNLLPLIENVGKPSCNNLNTSVKRIYGKRKTNAVISESPKVQIIETIKKDEYESNINLSSIKKIYHNRKCIEDPLADNETPESDEIIDHKYSKNIITNIEETTNCDSMYTITLDLENIKEEHITENQIVILSVDDNGELTENNINVLLDAANIKTEISKDSDTEVVAFAKNVDSEDFNNKLSNIFVVRTNDGNIENEHILGVENMSS